MHMQHELAHAARCSVPLGTRKGENYYAEKGVKKLFFLRITYSSWMVSVPYKFPHTHTHTGWSHAWFRQDELLGCYWVVCVCVCDCV